MIKERLEQSDILMERRISMTPEVVRLSRAPTAARAFSKSLVIISEPNGVQAESIRALRTHLLAKDVASTCRGLAICSASTGAGCSYIAANLAIALSQIGANTLLIDGNMREPAIDTLIPPVGGADGLKQYLSSSDSALSDYIQPDVLPNLSVMYAGGAATNAQDLLASDRFKDLMGFCRRDFDITLVDTPAANTFSDARRIATVAGHCLIVTRRHVSFVHDMKVLASQVEADGGQVLGTVLNQN